MALRVVGGGVRGGVTRWSFGRLLGCSAVVLALFGCGSHAPPAPQTAKAFVLTVRIAGDGQGAIAGGPIDCGSRCSGSVSADAAPVVLVAQPAEDSMVSNWSVAGCDGNRCSIIVDRDLTVAINFSRKVPPVPPPSTPKTRRLTVALERDGSPFDGSGFTTVSAEGTILNCPSTCAADLPNGSNVRLDFKTSNPYQPFSNWRLAAWRGPCVPAGDSCTIKLDQDANVTAVVEIHPRLVVLVFNPRLSAGRGTFVADRAQKSVYSYDYQIPRNELGTFVLEVGESVTLTPAPDASSHFAGWTGACASAGTGPCKLTATRSDSVNLALSFDPNVDPRYRLTQMVPLADATAMRSGRVVGSLDGFAAAYDIGSGRVTKLLANASARAVNRLGDVAGETNGHPFVAYATQRTVVLDTISGRAVALHDGGIMLGTADNPPFAGRPTFTFDGANTTWLSATDFWGRTINNLGAIGGCIVGAGLYPTGGIFQNGMLSQTATNACVDHLDAAGTFVGTNWWAKTMRRIFLWDGSTHDLWDLTEANDLAEDGTVAGSIDVDGYFAGRTSDTYVFGLHAGLYAGGQAQDLNFVTDTSSHPELAHLAMERALAIDAGKVLVSFRNGQFGVIEAVQKR